MYILVGGLYIIVIVLFILICLYRKASKEDYKLWIEFNDTAMNYAAARVTTLRSELDNVVDQVKLLRGEMLESKDALIATLTQKVKGYAGESLLRYMKELSEDFFCCGWEGNLEYRLWRTVVEETPVDEESEEKTKAIQLTLKYLAQDAGGWWVKGNEFVPMNEWLEMYEKKFLA